jgi:hypothetical protein
LGQIGAVAGQYGGNIRGAFGGKGEGGFDPRAAAEWTFYYDQLVLWQYYCARILLHDQEESLLEEGAGGDDAAGQVEEGAGGPPAGSVAATIASRERSRSPNAGVGTSFIDEQSGGFYAKKAAAGAKPGDAMEVREQFDAEADYADPERVMAHHRKFIDAATLNEESLYANFIDMITRIDQRELGQEKYTQWLEAKQKDIFSFADSWRQVEEGETLMVDDSLFLVTREPLESVPIDSINVLKNEQLTPQDLLNPDGTVKKAEIY